MRWFSRLMKALHLRRATHHTVRAERHTVAARHHKNRAAAWAVELARLARRPFVDPAP